MRARSGLAKASLLLEEKIREHVGWTDHTLAELRSMGNPYGRGSNPGGRARAAPPHGPFDVHIQTSVRRGPASPTVSKLLSDSIFREVVDDKNTVVAKVGVDTTTAPHAIYIIDGTRTMIQRDFLRGSYEEVKNRLAKEFDEGFGRA